ncbi:hypothetical protein [Phenylobacterium sp.]|uniref:hypothetical protein n=1 Tax=Phenylobacterium sp. TaxID=1871053 RepID=UPI0027359457|nr:hypothetical protein [Phenylobacterium sp.]MDP3854232.1 hypothetical protein [Phenylobacterium sp.]
MAEFLERRWREKQHDGQEAVARAHLAFGNAVRAGEDLVLKTRGDVMRYGAKLIAEETAPGVRPAPVRAKPQRPSTIGPVATKPPAPVSQTATGPRRAQPSRTGWLDHPTARAVGGELAREVGNVTGALRGGWHAAEGLYDGAAFLHRLASPFDSLMSPPGESAREQLIAVGRGIGEYVKKGVSDPQSVVRDIQGKAHQMRFDLDPTATSAAPTFSGEIRRNFDIGQNQGELAFDVGSLAVGGPFPKAVGRLGAVPKATTAEKYLAQGFSPAGAAYLALPYKGMGHHVIRRSYRLPQSLGGGPLPRTLTESEFFVLKPEGMTRGDFYELHRGVDDHFYGTRLPRRVGGERWSAKDLGLKKYDQLGRIWHGSPAPLKARVGGLTAGAGASFYESGEGQQ